MSVFPLTHDYIKRFWKKIILSFKNIIIPKFSELYIFYVKNFNLYDFKMNNYMILDNIVHVKIKKFPTYPFPQIIYKMFCEINSNLIKMELFDA